MANLVNYFGALLKRYAFVSGARLLLLTELDLELINMVVVFSRRSTIARRCINVTVTKPGV